MYNYLVGRGRGRNGCLGGHIFYTVEKIDVENRTKKAFAFFFVLFCISETFLHDNVVRFLFAFSVSENTLLK